MDEERVAAREASVQGPRRTRTLSFHSDRDRPRLHFRGRGATPGVGLYTYVASNEMDLLARLHGNGFRWRKLVDASYSTRWPRASNATPCASLPSFTRPNDL